MKKILTLSASLLLLASCGAASSSSIDQSASAASSASFSASASASASAANSVSASNSASASASASVSASISAQEAKKEARLAAAKHALSVPVAALGNMKFEKSIASVAIDENGQPNGLFGSTQNFEGEIADNKLHQTQYLVSTMSAAEFKAGLTQMGVTGVSGMSNEELIAAFEELKQGQNVPEQAKSSTIQLNGDGSFTVKAKSGESYREATSTQYNNYQINGQTGKWKQGYYEYSYLEEFDADSVGLFDVVSPLHFAAQFEDLPKDTLVYDAENDVVNLDLTKVCGAFGVEAKGIAAISFDQDGHILAFAASFDYTRYNSTSHLTVSWEFSDFGKASVTLPGAADIELCDHKDNVFFDGEHDEYHYQICYDCNSRFGLEKHQYEDDRCLICNHTSYAPIEEEIALGENKTVTISLRQGGNTKLIDGGAIDLAYNEVAQPVSGSGLGEDGTQVRLLEAGLTSGEVSEGYFFLRLEEKLTKAEGEDPCLYNVKQTITYYYTSNTDAERFMEICNEMEQLTLPSTIGEYFDTSAKLDEYEGKRHEHKLDAKETLVDENHLKHETYCTECEKVFESYIEEVE